MLEPQSRQLLLNSLHAPADYRLDWAVGTTYSLDLLAILSAPVAFAFSDWHDKDGRPTMDPLALLKAVRQYADRICLFCQAGKIRVPRSYLPLLVNLEDSIVEATAPRGGSFHPKVWFLRYFSDDGSIIYRMLCLSRNMTFDRSWDTMLCLEGPLGKQIIARNRSLGQFAEALPNMAVRSLSPIWQERLSQLATEIRRVDLEMPAPFEEIAFWPIGIGEHAVWPFPDRVDRMLVVSPFVDDGFIAGLADHQAPMQLLSRPESLAFLKPESLEQFDNAWVLDDTAEPEAAELEESEEPASKDTAANSQGVSTPDSNIPLVGLHAKVYVTDVGWRAHVWTGSANATTAGFDQNVELLVQLTGKRSNCGVDAVLGEPNAKSGKRTACLADLLRPYQTHDKAVDDDQAEREFERKVDRLACSLAAADPTASCAAGTTTESFSVTLLGHKPLNTQLPQGWVVLAWPISLSESAARGVDPARSPWVQFETVSFDGITSFFAFEVRSPAESLSRRFVLNVPLMCAPINRREHILRSMLSDPARVLRFLLLLLADHDARDFGTLFPSPTSPSDKRSAVHSMFEFTLFESLLKALDREPARIDQVAQVVNDLCQTPEGRELLPKGFGDLWATVWAVRQRQLQPLTRRTE